MKKHINKRLIELQNNPIEPQTIVEDSSNNNVTVIPNLDNVI
jgi:hypothetical protein